MLTFYFFRHFLFLYLVTFFAIVTILIVNEVLIVLVSGENIQNIFWKIVDFLILFGSLILSLSFIIAFCIYFIKFSKSFEFIAIRSLGVSFRKIFTPIFYFSIFCGLLIYINQTYFASWREALLLRNYENINKEWTIEGNKLSYFHQEKDEIIDFFLSKNSSKIEKIDIISKQKKKQIRFFNEQIIEKENSHNLNLQEKKKSSLEVKNFFYLGLEELYPLGKKRHVLFSYIFFQKIADMLIPVFLFFIFLGRPLHPRNTDLEKKMVFRVSFCILFILSNQLGIFLFKANNSYPFFYAFFSHIFWAAGLLIRYFQNEKY